SADELLQRVAPGLHHKVARSDRRRAAVRGPLGARRGLLPGLPRRPAVEQEGEQPAALDQREAAAGGALAVEGSAREAVLQRAVVREPELRGRYLVALTVREQRTAALDCVGGQHPADEAEEARRHQRVEDDRAAAARGLAGTR